MHAVRKLKSYNSFKLFSQKLKLENIYLKIMSHIEGQKTWFKDLGSIPNFDDYLNRLFGSLHVMIATGDYFSLTHLTNNIKDCIEKIWINCFWTFFSGMEILKVTAYV